MAGSGKPIERRALDPLTPHRYKRDEQPKRVGFWYIGVGTATILGSLMSFGFQHYTGTTFSAWQIMFLVIGCMTMLVGSSVLLFLPDNPMTARRLTHAERVLAVERLRENQTGVENKHFKPYQVLACLSDPQTWLLSIITIAASIPNGAVGSFQSILIKGFGFTNYQTTLLQIPGGVIAVTSVLLATWSAAKFNARAANIILWSAMGGILGGSLLAFLPEDNRAGKMAGNYLTHVVGSFLPCAYSFAAANTGGHTKKVTMNAVLLMSFCLGESPVRSAFVLLTTDRTIGNILGPLTFRDKDKPLYVPAKVTIVVVDSVAILTTVVLLLYYRWQNKTRDRANLAHTRDVEFADLTDRENKEFRYKY